MCIYHIIALICILFTSSSCSKWGDDSADISQFVGSWRCAYEDGSWYMREDLTINSDRSYSKSVDYNFKATNSSGSSSESGLVSVNSSFSQIIFKENSNAQHIYTVVYLSENKIILSNSEGQKFQYANIVSE